MEPEIQNTQPKNSQEGIGPMAGIVIILIVFIVGGFYFWKETIEEQKRQAAELEALQNEPEFVDETATTTLEEIPSGEF